MTSVYKLFEQTSYCSHKFLKGEAERGLKKYKEDFSLPQPPPSNAIVIPYQLNSTGALTAIARWLFCLPTIS